MTYGQSDAILRWNQNAAAWHRIFGENDPNRRDLLDPLIFQTLGEIAGRRILDAGCGDGYLARKLSQLGAVVTGIEAAGELLAFAIAEETKAASGITYVHGDVSAMPFFKDNSFEVVVTNNVIQDVEDYQGAFREFSRVLLPGGRYIHIENHPCYSLQGSGWVRDEQGNRLFRKVDNYFRRGPFLAQWRPQTGMQPTVTWHRTLGDIMNSLVTNGLQIAKVVEPEPPESWRDDVQRSDAFRIPDFLVLVCTKH